MAIDPNTINTVRVGELPSTPFSGTDLIPHEVGAQLKKGTLEDMATFIATLIGSSDAIGFRAVTVLDGQTLPSVTAGKNEFILVGKGTFPNVGGGATITTTEELNALITTGTSWSIGVEIPIDAPDSGGGGAAFPKQQFTANGIQDSFTLSGTELANAVFWNGALLDDSDWLQSGSTLTLTFTPASGDIIKPI
jgi:hypothetical protein